MVSRLDDADRGVKISAIVPEAAAPGRALAGVRLFQVDRYTGPLHEMHRSYTLIYTFRATPKPKAGVSDCIHHQKSRHENPHR